MTTENTIFVFGSNLAGRHGRGAALYALKHHGAIYGRGEGPQGNSYAIPTKDKSLRTLPLKKIKDHVLKFLIHADQNPHLTFNLTAIGCGLAGLNPKQVGPMFKGAPANVLIPNEFIPFV